MQQRILELSREATVDDLYELDEKAEIIDGQIVAPAFAIEVRSEGDYGLRAEREMAAKRADYFAAGTAIVWDVDVLREGVIRSFRSDTPQFPQLFGRGEIADAEPAVPGWRFGVDELFG